MIAIKDISVVVQGKIDPVWTKQSLVSIRQHLPEATILLSTWEGDDVAPLTGLYDQLILTKDDCFVFYNEFYVRAARAIQSKPQNINRQITSTCAGLRQVTTKYAIKMRSDMVIEGTGFLTAFENYKERTPDLRVFQERIVIGCHTTRIARACTFFNAYKYPFTLSDFFGFGLTRDLLQVWDAPSYSEADAYYFKDNDPAFRRAYGYRVKSHMRLMPEQYIWLNGINKKMPLQMQTFFDNTKEKVSLFEAFVGNNLIVLPQEKIHISLPRRDAMYMNKFFDFSFVDWLYLYEKQRGVNAFRIFTLKLQREVVRLARLLPEITRLWRQWAIHKISKYLR